MASKPTVVPYDAVMWWVVPRSSSPPAMPASIPATDIVQMINRFGDIPA